jgi:hypothetical protein
MAFACLIIVLLFSHYQALLATVEYDTHDLWEGRVGVSYAVSKRFSLMAHWHSEFMWGAGLQIRF